MPYSPKQRTAALPHCGDWISAGGEDLGEMRAPLRSTHRDLSIFVQKPNSTVRKRGRRRWWPQGGAARRRLRDSERRRPKIGSALALASSTGHDRNKSRPTRLPNTTIRVRARRRRHARQRQDRVPVKARRDRRIRPRHSSSTSRRCKNAKNTTLRPDLCGEIGGRSSAAMADWNIGEVGFREMRPLPWPITSFDGSGRWRARRRSFWREESGGGGCSELRRAAYGNGAVAELWRLGFASDGGEGGWLVRVRTGAGGYK